ncbi:MAG: T9SS type A sorting domain-containing protein [Flavobacteriia bacterium]|nr:T9SS type A sorting domain-containing protein [Flavobacteriia bacterium]
MTFSQTNINIQFQSKIASICSQLTLSMAHDSEDRPFLYVANKEAGLRVFNISDLTTPTLVATISTSSFLGMEVINLTQQGNYIYLALGNIWNSDSTGMAIIDVQNPNSPFVTDYYFKPNSIHGAGIVQVEGDFAYLGAMQDGLIVLNVADKYTIQFESQFIPDINFPINNPNNVNVFNLRGMEVRNDTVFACYDGGGIRVIDVTNKQQPIEISHYCNSVMYTPLDHPKAYNNIVLNDTLAYVAVDYCGVEVLNISDPLNIQLIGWWNPYDCPNNNWFTSPVHTNEIRLNSACNQLFVSSGKSDMYVLDVTNPTYPDSLDFYGGVENNLGTWGVNIYSNQIYLSYACVPWPYIPFQSDSTGIKILTYDNCANELNNNEDNRFQIFPNPVKNELTVKLLSETRSIYLEIIDLSGKIIRQEYLTESKTILNMNELISGIYYAKLISERNIFIKRFLVE